MGTFFMFWHILCIGSVRSSYSTSLHLFPKRNLIRTFDQSRILLRVRIFTQTRIPLYQIPCNTKYFQPPFISNKAVARERLPHSSLYWRCKFSFFSFTLSFVFPFSLPTPASNRYEVQGNISPAMQEMFPMSESIFKAKKHTHHNLFTTKRRKFLLAASVCSSGC